MNYGRFSNSTRRRKRRFFGDTYPTAVPKTRYVSTDKKYTTANALNALNGEDAMYLKGFQS